MLPVYQPDRTFLKEALAGPLGTGCAADEFQIEVVDDCSPTIDVEAMLREIAGDRVSYFRSPTNLGLAGCWNLCIKRAQGHWVHILHQDDIVDSRFYETLDDVVQKHPSAVAAHSRHAFCDMEGHWLALSVLESRESGLIPDFNIKLAAGQRVQCASVAVRRDTYDAVGSFDPKWRYVLDWEMWSRIACSGPWAYAPDILAIYRTHSGSETQRLTESDSVLPEIWSGGLTINHYLPVDRRAKAWGDFQAHFAVTVLGVANEQIKQGLWVRAIFNLRRFPWSPASARFIPSCLRAWLKLLLSMIGRPIKTS